MLFLFILISNVRGQAFGYIETYDGEAIDSFRIPKMTLLISPTSFLPLPLGAIQFGFEHRFDSPKNAMHHELGIFHPMNLSYQSYYDLLGFRIRSGYRRYLPKPRRKGNLFVGTQYFFQYESWDLDGWFDRLGNSYQEYFIYEKKVVSNGLLAIFGGNRIASKGRRFLIDWQVGLGMKYRTVDNKGVPDDAEAVDERDFLINVFLSDENEESGSLFLPTGHISFKFGYILK